MRIEEILNSLGARVLDDNLSQSADIDLVESRLTFDITGEYRELLLNFIGAIVFDEGAIYTPTEKSPVDSENGHQSLEVLYGIDGSNNLVEKNEMYKNQLPAGYLVIGESFGGNQICVSRDNLKVYFWYHESELEKDSMFEISESIEHFLCSLSKDDSLGANNKLIDESESFLNF